MDGKFDALAQILSEIRKDNKEIKESVVTVNSDYSELRTRVERLEKKIGLAK
jgi:predicted nuclease with TOPRIM domain